MSKAKPSRSKRPTAPPYVAERSYTVTRWPATASRAAAAIAPIPAPIITIRAMPGTVSAATDIAVRSRSDEESDEGSTDAEAIVTRRHRYFLRTRAYG
ncbi:hypothetical protein GCM10017557_60960 [Streptomyces aurantiacus]|uniref:Uncharacterized protein n=1 Tax=Streptomyces aurantiacus TaxID=47760 RepID=A0A7G1PBX4_9ACTN|nr:hypothetical protein GCM10017557_60960 [Streptomyces aurantiacus]